MSITEKIDSVTEWEDHASQNQDIHNTESVNETTGYDAYGTVHREQEGEYNATIITTFDGHAKEESHSKAVTTWDSDTWSSDVTTKKTSEADYTFSEKEEGTSSGTYVGWMSNGYGGWSASENWDESNNSDWNTKFEQHEDYSATLNYSYTIDQTGIRSDESFNEHIKGSGEIDRTSNRNDSVDKEHNFSEGSWSGYASRYTDENTQTKSDDKYSNTYDFETKRSSLNDTITPENHLNTSQHSTKTVSGDYYQHYTFGGGGSPGGEGTITDPLYDYTPIDESHSETNSSPGFANQNSLPKLIKPLTADGVSSGIEGNYPAASTASPQGPTKVKVDIPLIDKGEPNFSNFGIPDMDAALNPPPLPVSADNPLYGNPASTEPPGVVQSFFIGMWSGVHNALDIAGIIPGVGEIADGANVLIYLAEGDKINAGLSAAAMIPVVGVGATAGKAAKKKLLVLLVMPQDKLQNMPMILSRQE